jgi:hypothetical protein
MDLKELIPSRYRVSYDQKTGSFWILDCWHETVKNIPDITNAVIPETSPALTIISSEQANALIGEQLKLGWFDRLKTNEVKPPIEIKQNVSIEEVAINKVAEIVKIENLKDDVAKEAIMAIRELGSKK